MKNKDDKNVETITRTGELTPLELWEKRSKENANLVRLMHDTMTLVTKLEEAREMQSELPIPIETLETLAAEALVGIAQELETHYGISA
tara:strand:- start:206 stop:472 length:267 start_codon:yes stop_codon:yes gene_type:complete